MKKQTETISQLLQDWLGVLTTVVLVLTIGNIHYYRFCDFSRTYMFRNIQANFKHSDWCFYGLEPLLN